MRGSTPRAAAGIPLHLTLNIRKTNLLFTAPNIGSLAFLSCGHLSTFHSCPPPLPSAAGGSCPPSKPFSMQPALTSHSSRSRLRVAVGISGGVDSSVAAWLLQQQGFEVLGVFMRNWDSSDEAGREACSQTADLKSAQAVAAHLRIPLKEADFIQDYWTKVFDPFLTAYSQLKTPNPDVLCNRFVKFGSFRQYALSVLGADAVATGHYAQLWPAIASPWREQLPLQHGGSCVVQGQRGMGAAAEGEERQSLPLLPSLVSPSLSHPLLLSSVDVRKDQSDFLSLVPGSSLSRVMFPLGCMTKPQVRSLAAAAGLPTAARKDSVGICFIGKRDLQSFLGGYMPLRTAILVDISSGRVVAELPQAGETLTVGQGARLGGLKDRYFVVGKQQLRRRRRENERASAEEDRVDAVPGPGSASAGLPLCGSPSPPVAAYVAAGVNHPSLFTHSCCVKASNFNWIASQPPLQPSSAGEREEVQWLPVSYRIRHNQSEAASGKAALMRRSQYSSWCKQQLAAGQQGAAGGRSGDTAAAALTHWAPGQPPLVRIAPQPVTAAAAAAAGSSAAKARGARPAAEAATSVIAATAPSPAGSSACTAVWEQSASIPTAAAGQPAASAFFTPAATVPLATAAAPIAGSRPLTPHQQQNHTKQQQALSSPAVGRTLAELGLEPVQLQADREAEKRGGEDADDLLLVVQFEKAERAVAAGQILVLYSREPVLTQLSASSTDLQAGGVRLGEGSEEGRSGGMSLASCCEATRPFQPRGWSSSSMPTQAGSTATEQPPSPVQQHRLCFGGGSILSAGPTLWDIMAGQQEGEGQEGAEMVKQESKSRAP